MTKQIIKKTQLLVLLLLFVNSVNWAQSDNKKDLKQLHDYQNEDTEPAFSDLVTPGKYTNESMVMMAEKMKIIQVKNPKKRSNTNPYPEQYAEYLRTRIKLNDLNAIENFSDYEFEAGDEIEIKIFKPDGKTIEVDLKDAVDADNVKSSNKYFNLFLGTKKRKIAIKNLEIGDIIDFSSYNKYTNFTYNSTYFTNIPSMPIVYLKNEFLINKTRASIAFKNFNGAQSLTKKQVGKQTAYSFECKMVDKRKNEILSNDIQTDPYYKLIIYFNTSESYPFYTKPKNNELISKLSETNLKEYSIQTVTSNKVISDSYLQFLRTEDVYSLSDDDYVKKYYILLRNNAFLSDLAFNFKEETKGLTFLGDFIVHLDRRDIDFEVLMLASKEVAELKDIINPNDLSWGLRYKINGKYHYITTFSSSSQIDEISTNFENTEAYAVKGLFLNKKKTKLTRFTMPSTSNEENIYKVNITAAFNNTLDSLKLNIATEAKGNQRDNRFNLVKNAEYFKDYCDFLKQRRLTTKKRKLYYFVGSNYYRINKEFYNKEEERLGKQHFEELEKGKQKNLENEARKEYYVLKYDKFEPISDGRTIKNPNTSWKEQFTIGNTVQVAGKSQVFEIGRVLGRLAVINDNEDRSSRTKPFFIDYNKTFTMNVSIKVPAGKSVVGLENLNISIMNKVGSLVSNAKIENGFIVWTLTKKLNGYKHEISEWKDYLNITDSGTQLNNAKIIFN